MIDNSKLPSPYIITVLENYFNERPVTVHVDISKLPQEHGYRRAVVDALNNEHDSVRVSYETFGTYRDVDGAGVKPKGATIRGSVTLDEDSILEYDGYTVPEDWDEEDMAWWVEQQTNPTLDERDKNWVAQMYHAGAIPHEVIGARFNLTAEQVEAIGKQISVEDLDKGRAAAEQDAGAFISGLGRLF